MPSWRAADAGPAALLRGKSTASSLVLFRVTCSDSCTHVKLIRHHFTLRCPYAAQLLPVTLVRLQLWQQNRVNDSQTSPTVPLQICTSNPHDFLLRQTAAQWALIKKSLVKLNQKKGKIIALHMSAEIRKHILLRATISQLLTHFVK